MMFAVIFPHHGHLRITAQAFYRRKINTRKFEKVLP